TQLSSQIRRISATVASSRSRARSTPEISAPSAPAILCTSIVFAAGESLLTPYLVGQFDDRPELRPLLVFREGVSLPGRGAAALGAERQLVERDVFGRLVDAALYVGFLLQRAGLRGDEAQHHGLVALGDEAQRLEPAGAVGVVFEEIAVVAHA